MSSATTRTDRARVSTGTVEVPGGLPLEHGATLEPCRVRYEMVGPSGAPVVPVLGGISATRHLVSHPGDAGEGWWPAQAGTGRPLDPGRFRLLAVDWIHGARRTEPLPVTPADQADAVAAVLEALDVGRVPAAVGASYGGMVLLALAARHPERLARALVIAAAHESHPMATGLRSLQRKIVRLGLETGRARDGMALARSLAMTTYRSDREFDARFEGSPRLDAPDARARFPVDGYLENRGRHFAERMSPGRFLCLCQSLDLHRVEPDEVAVPVTLVSVDTDTLVPPWQVRALYDALPAEAELITVSSLRGHDAFLTDREAFEPILDDFLDAAGGTHVHGE